MECNIEYRQINDELLEYCLQIFKQTYYLTTDSRKIQPNCIFVALKGIHFNGNSFAQQVLQDGAKLAIIDDKQYYIDNRTLLVENTEQFLQLFANYYRKTFKIPFIAISGTNGKTTTKELIKAVLQTKYKVHATQGNFNNQLGVPFTLLDIKPDTEIAIIEMGASHIGDIKQLCDIAMPDYALLTNIGIAHIEGFGSLNGVIQTKLELFDYVNKYGKKIFVNIDDVNLSNNKPENAITYSLYNNADITAKINEINTFFASIIFDNNTIINSNLVGQYNCINILAAITVGIYFDIPINKIKQAIENYIPSNNRSQILITPSNKVIMDCYNANPSSCKTALETFERTLHHNKWLFLGAMKELGKVSKQEHQNIVNIIKNMNITQAIFIGQEYYECVKNTDFLWFATSEQAKQYVFSQKITDALILIKGSRVEKMEVLADVL